MKLNYNIFTQKNVKCTFPLKIYQMQALTVVGAEYILAYICVELLKGGTKEIPSWKTEYT